MTAFDRFDPFERRLSEAIDEIALARRPDYLDDVLQLTARSSQRPRWTFPERWLRMDTAVPLPGIARRVPLRSALLLALLVAALLAATAFIVGSRQRVLLPFGPADNGSLVFAQGGDIYVRDSLTGNGRLLIGGPGEDAFAFYSPSGQLVGFSTTVDGSEYLKVAKANGSDVRKLLDEPVVEAGAVWRPDSQALALDTTLRGAHRLLIVPVDGSAAAELDLGGLRPSNVTWRPPDGQVLLFRGLDAAGKLDLYTVNADGTGLKALGLPGESSFGVEWTLTGAAWSPDGQTIAYNSIGLDQGGSNLTHFRVGLRSPDGTLKVLAGPSDPRVQEAWPAFSPDGKRILVHRWVFKADSPSAEGWVAVMPTDGSAPARDVGPHILGGEDTGGTKLWSPDGNRILWRAGNTQQVFSVDPSSGEYETLPWTTELPDWQRVATR